MSEELHERMRDCHEKLITTRELNKNMSDRLHEKTEQLDHIHGVVHKYETKVLNEDEFIKEVISASRRRWKNE